MNRIKPIYTIALFCAIVTPLLFSILEPATIRAVSPDHKNVVVIRYPNPIAAILYCYSDGKLCFLRHQQVWVKNTKTNTALIVQDLALSADEGYDQLSFVHWNQDSHGFEFGTRDTFNNQLTRSYRLDNRGKWVVGPITGNFP